MQMMGIPIQAIAIGLVAGGFAVTLNMLALIMIGKINQKLPLDERVSYFNWGSGIKKQYRGLYPESNLIIIVRVCEILLILCFVALFWSLRYRPLNSST